MYYKCGESGCKYKYKHKTVDEAIQELKKKHPDFYNTVDIYGHINSLKLKGITNLDFILDFINNLRQGYIHREHLPSEYDNLKEYVYDKKGGRKKSKHNKRMAKKYKRKTRKRRGAAKKKRQWQKEMDALSNEQVEISEKANKSLFERGKMFFKKNLTVEGKEEEDEIVKLIKKHNESYEVKQKMEKQQVNMPRTLKPETRLRHGKILYGGKKRRHKTRRKRKRRKKTRKKRRKKR